MTETFDFTGDFKTKFKEASTRIVRQDIENQTEKNRLIQDVTDAYIAATGERPESRELDELASWAYFGYKGLTENKRGEVKVSLHGEYVKARRENACGYCGKELIQGEKAKFDREYLVLCKTCSDSGVR